MHTNGTEGITPSERYLSKLCRKTFLSLWSYSNLHTDEGRKKRKGVGHELCDLLVVFGSNIIIFSIKHVEFNRSIDIQVAWNRWFKKTILKSANQLYGAESWILRYPDRIFIDPHCQKEIPIKLPNINTIKVYRIVVALGIYHACREFWGGKSLGSLMVNSYLKGEQHYNSLFQIGHINPEKGFVHVFEDFTLDAILRELDTIADFVAYLSKKECLLSLESPEILSAGEEQLLSIYLTKLNSAGEHDFILPTENCDFLYLDEGFWEKMVHDPQYLAKKREDRISYAWDRLIEHFINYGRGYDLSGNNEVPIKESEFALRLMASEPRLARRELAFALLNLMETASKERGGTRLIVSSNFPNVAYLFLVIPKPEGQIYDVYREERKGLLLAYCKVAKLLAQDAKYIVGIATEPMGTKGASENLIALDVSEWTAEKQEEAKSLQHDFSLLLPRNIKKTEFKTKEYPDLPTIDEKLPKRPLNRKQRRAIESKLRHRK